MQAGASVPYCLDGPVELSVTISRAAEAMMAPLVPGSVRETPRVVSFRAADAVAAWKGCFAVLLLGWSASGVVYG